MGEERIADLPRWEAIESGCGVVGAHPCDEEWRERIVRQNMVHDCEVYTKAL